MPRRLLPTPLSGASTKAVAQLLLRGCQVRSSLDSWVLIGAQVLDRKWEEPPPCLGSPTRIPATPPREEVIFNIEITYLMCWRLWSSLLCSIIRYMQHDVANIPSQMRRCRKWSDVWVKNKAPLLYFSVTLRFGAPLEEIKCYTIRAFPIETPALNWSHTLFEK